MRMVGELDVPEEVSPAEAQRERWRVGFYQGLGFDRDEVGFEQRWVVRKEKEMEERKVRAAEERRQAEWHAKIDEMVRQQEEESQERWLAEVKVEVEKRKEEEEKRIKEQQELAFRRLGEMMREREERDRAADERIREKGERRREVEAMTKEDRDVGMRARKRWRKLTVAGR